MLNWHLILSRVTEDADVDLVGKTVSGQKTVALD
jgi:hypothetical protein